VFPYHGLVIGAIGRLLHKPTPPRRPLTRIITRCNTQRERERERERERVKRERKRDTQVNNVFMHAPPLSFLQCCKSQLNAADGVSLLLAVSLALTSQLFMCSQTQLTLILFGLESTWQTAAAATSLLLAVALAHFHLGPAPLVLCACEGVVAVSETARERERDKEREEQRGGTEPEEQRGRRAWRGKRTLAEEKDRGGCVTGASASSSSPSGASTRGSY
jgi:hypothetical protein